MMCNRGRPTLLNEPKQITVNVEFSVYKTLIAESRRHRLSMSELVRRAIDGWLVEQQPLRPPDTRLSL